MGTDKLGSIFSFIVKSAFPINNDTLKKITKSFKKKIITEMSYAQSLQPQKQQDEDKNEESLPEMSDIDSK